MLRRPAGVESRTARAVRGLWPDHNPLRRRLDRVEAVIVAGLAVGLVAGAPLVTVAASHVAHGIGTHAVQAQRAARHQVTAVLLEEAPASRYANYEVEVWARWTAPGGTRHTGTVMVPEGTRAGAAVTVWLDSSGEPVEPPLAPSQVRGQAVVAAALASLSLVILLLLTGLAAHAVVERRRAAAWEADWESTEPRWTHHRH